MERFLSSSAEQRLIRKGDIGQLGRDIKDFHIRADDPLAAAGSVVMAPAAAIAKAGNAIVGSFSPEPAVPLGESGFKYIARDVQSLANNAVGAVRNLLTLHPLRAAGNVVKGAFDAVDLVTVDPLLDVGSGIFGHQNKVRRSVGSTLGMAA
jgi:hypothetical protein